MPQAILAINAGSSSIKFAAYTVTDSELKLAYRGMLDQHAGDTHFVVKDAAGKCIPAEKSGPLPSDLVISLLGRVEPLLGETELVAIGHRIVHGGPHFGAPALLNSEIVERLDALTPLAPLHQPACLAPVRSLLSARPKLLQVACFDTAFHGDLAPIYRRLPLPQEFDTKLLHRYGFHGLSFDYITRRLNRPDSRMVVAHLGSGSSLCAIRDGRSINTTMSLTPLDGVMMGTRSGAIDPGLLLYLLKSEKMSAADTEDLLYRKSGLLGVSGLSADMRRLLASEDATAKDAIDQFCARVAEQIAVMATAIEGIEMLIFTGGIGENSPEIRKNVCARLGWIGLRLDDKANETRQEHISLPESKSEVLVIPTDEELTIARHTLAGTRGVRPI